MGLGFRVSPALPPLSGILRFGGLSSVYLLGASIEEGNI